MPLQPARRRVGEIASAAEEQGRGLWQATGAEAQFDPVTQQNAAPVEQRTAAPAAKAG